MIHGHLEWVSWMNRLYNGLCQAGLWGLVVLAGGIPPAAGQTGQAGTNGVQAEDLIQVHPKALRQISAEPAELRPLMDEVSLPGKIQYSENGYSRVSSPLVGLVKEVRVRLGDHVTPGQILVAVESADIGVAYSEFAKAESDLQLAQRNYDISKDLYEVQAIPKKEFVQAQSGYLKAQAEYRRSKGRLLSLRVPAEELNKPIQERQITGRFELKSPIKGTIVERNVTVGQLVGADPAQVLFTIADLDILQAVADVYERDVRALAVGQKVTVSVESFPGERFPGSVVYVGDLVDPVARTIKVRCNVTNLGGKLKPEMFARVHVQLGAKATALAVQRSAVIMTGDERILFVQRTETEFERRRVVTGIASGDLIEIRQGIQPGERVAVKGALLLKGAWDKKRSRPATGTGAPVRQGVSRK
jgi:cobalt-zinc-cadmium efflux system membrane fusion protein